MVRDEIAKLLTEAAAAAQRSGVLPQVALPEVSVEPPQRAEHGDYATNLAMRLARAARMAPPQIAQVLVQSLPPNDIVERADVAGAGFINFTLKPEWMAQRVAEILGAGPQYGGNNQGEGKRVQVEFVSANPTERLHAGSGRAAALGDSLANLLALSGWRVEREYYVNDAGSRQEALGQTIWARYQQALGREAEVPKDGYHGEYLAAYGRELASQYGDTFLKEDPATAVRKLTRMGIERFVSLHEADMAALGVHFDQWFREQTLHDDEKIEQVLNLLVERGYVTEREGAVWFTSTALGDDKDNVLVRSSGVPGYFAADIAYHRNKFIERGFDRVIDIWGADHQGHVSRMKVAMQALGVDPDRLTIIIHQLVTLRRGSEIVKLSKRAGNIVALADVIEEVGKDACRWFFLQRSPDSQMEFDLDLAASRSFDNPVYNVQYSHARCASILRFARERGLAVDEAALPQGAPLSLEHPAERLLARALLRYPEVVYDAASQLGPHHLTFFALELAGVLNGPFYEQCRVLPSKLRPNDPPQVVSESRLRLVAATKQVLANILGLIGVSAPDVMERLEEEESPAATAAT